jgi:hypothetical protein
LLFAAKYFIVLGVGSPRVIDSKSISGSDRMKLSAMMREPSAFLPVTMSSIALATLFVAFVTGGLVRETDEGTAAHIWQLLMGGQIPIVAYFAIKWLPQAPREALYVLALQVGVALAALAPVYLLHL